MHGEPVVQQGSPVPPQQTPVAPKHVPPDEQVPAGPTQSPEPLSQHASLGGTPLHVLPAQQAAPSVPQAWQLPAAQTSPPVPGQVVPAAMQLLLSQQFEP